MEPMQPSNNSPPRWKVPFIDLRATWARERHDLLGIMDEVAADARFILRQEVEELESRAAAFLGVKYAVAVGNGTDAITLGLKVAGVGPGDEVITVAHTFVATIASIVHCGATPVLVDIGTDFLMDPQRLQEAITPRTKAVIPVHLNGRCCDMEHILAIAARHGIQVIEDAAQAFGATLDGKHAGSFGLTAAFSFHPMKVLSCCGDGGLVTTNDEGLAEHVKRLRHHGQRNKTEIVHFGVNSRLDNLQAAILLYRLDRLKETLARRRHIAQRYHAGLSAARGITLPPHPGNPGDRYQDIVSTFVIRVPDRDAMQQHLTQQGIETFVHWSPPLHQRKSLHLSASLPVTEAVSDQALSLPVFPEMTDEQVDWVIRSILNRDHA
ncbi:MAG: DegT/DnrJ/EryC1/StrS family aminotransferase [Magnetococcales bacterium]|nr:DegT/DnrJ/EryC1/StrS family aminotransferase [Magnetococcales bacterium]MBF0150034.1 DegT/DnrJ/EryC1/StrS family aminotransferase [Magnetococcales bacterium]MBF0173510.1 DegT/DnrJ/EryC1/StrS family aminotransferase [Magnetococcales bacterium]MBF0629523.1 DegT/DnrJ/EryC1/StrS family aminotransferase [Magnetococcales bacterium]